MKRILEDKKLLSKYRENLEKDKYIKVEDRIKDIIELFE